MDRRGRERGIENNSFDDMLEDRGHRIFLTELFCPQQGFPPPFQATGAGASAEILHHRLIGPDVRHLSFHRSHFRIPINRQMAL